jgi:hypothetical protein
MDGNEQLRNALRIVAQRHDLRSADDDAAMRTAIADHFANTQRNRRGYRRMIAVWSAAAVVALAGVIAVRFLNPQMRTAPSTVAAVPGDVDGNGRVDILDALRLARDIEAGRTVNNDINSDGVVDGRDVDAIALRAVSLQLSGGQAG